MIFLNTTKPRMDLNIFIRASGAISSFADKPAGLGCLQIQRLTDFYITTLIILFFT